MKNIALFAVISLMSSFVFAHELSATQSDSYGSRTGSSDNFAFSDARGSASYNHKVILENAVQDALDVLSNLPPTDKFIEGKDVIAKVLGKTYSRGDEGNIEAAIDILEFNNVQDK